MFSNLSGNSPEAQDPSERQPEERRSLLNETEGDRSSAPISGSSLSASTTTGMNPQDDLEQPQHPQPTTTADDSALVVDSVNSTTTTPTNANTTGGSAAPKARKQPQSLEAGNGKPSMISRRRGRRRKRRNRSNSSHSEKVKDSAPGGPIDALCSMFLRTLCFDRAMVQNTLSCMNVMARVLVWSSVMALAAGVVWYSYELATNGTDKHLIAWFSAGAFVLLGFPLSMGSIVAHLANYNQPHVQCYIVRILWMVPLYSMGSWLCLRFHEKAIYIETLRDFYESFVLYSFFQFLIEVLGGEEALILMLKDKSPTRGSHIWGFQWCIKPWLMGQPVRRSDGEYDNDKQAGVSPRNRHRNSLKRVHWKSPFFVQCKFGVLQYVLLKFVCSFLAMIFETHGLYKEGNFTPKGGYLYICLVTNLSQCWALYCLILFYYATHNELGPIRPVGKFLSVKALVFFTWWQSVGISILYQMDMIPHYNDSKTTIDLSPEAVAKGIQDYLICVEMFLAAIVHTLVFPHTEYSPQAVHARARALNQSVTNPGVWQQRKRLGRHHQFHTNQVLRNYHHNRDDKSSQSESKSSFPGGDRSFFDLEMTTLSSGGGGGGASWEEPATLDSDGNIVSANRMRFASVDSMDSDLSSMVGTGNGDWASTPPHGSSDRLSTWDGVGHVDSPDDQPLLLSDSYARPGHPPPSLLQPSLNDRRNTIDEGVEEDGLWDSVDDEDDGEEFSSGDLSDDVIEDPDPAAGQKQSFVRAFLDSAIPRDLRDNTVGIVKGDYVVEKKTLLHHATTSDHYDLFSHTRRTNFRTRLGSLASKEEQHTK